MKWYHAYLLYVGLDQTEAMIQQHLYWSGIREDVHKEGTWCDVCQRTKCSTKKGKLTTKVAKETPWNKQCVDLIDHYKIRHREKETLLLNNVTIINTFIGWFEITQYNDKKVTVIENLVETTWLFRYIYSVQITYDQEG